MSNQWLTGEMLGEEFKQIHGAAKAAAMNRFLQALQPRAQRLTSDELRAKVYNRYVHKLIDPSSSPAGQTALCLSGGGIRSAAFALGIMQGLAKKNLLSKFHYLSTVSGGGYIGGWLMAWASRPNEAQANRRPNFSEIEAALGGSTASAPLRELRKGETFLTPRTGIGSPDTWMALAHVVRNMILNWTVFIPFLLAILLVPAALHAALQWWVQSAPKGSSSSLVELWRFLSSLGRAGAFQPTLHFWLDSVAAALVAIGLCVAMVTRTAAYNRALGDAGFLAFVLTPVTAGAVLLVAASAVWLNDGQLTPEMIRQWLYLCALAFPLIRVLALAASYTLANKRFSLWPLGPFEGFSPDPDARGLRFFWELLAQAVSGALVGAVIVAGLTAFVSYTGSDKARVAVAFGVPWFLISFLLGQTLLSALTSQLYRQTGDRNREWLARASGWYGFVALLWLVFSGISLYSSYVIQRYLPSLTLATVGSGLLSVAGGASPLTKAVFKIGKSRNIRFSQVITGFAVLTILGLLILFAHCTTLLFAHGTTLLRGFLVAHWGNPAVVEPQLAAACIIIAGLILLSAAASYFVNVNYFSLGGLYRNRLVRAFLGASNITPITGTAPGRNPFDGLAEADNIPMSEQLPGLLARRVPFHVANMTLNLTATKNTGWQERKAASFVSTPLATGGHEVGYRNSEDYARGSPRNKGISLGTAMAISGAAVSPNWGYHSSPITSFLMALFNVRLGSWLGNPKHPTTYLYDGPRFGLQRLWQEALGQVSDESRYVYLSDGGHFENLGLYEMVRRRCHTIIVSDAGMDESCKLEDLGNAIRKIAIDLDIRIEFEQILVEKRGKDMANPGVYCAVGNIYYPERKRKPPGQIVYIKPGLYQDAPADVRAYAAANAAFPHDNTLNQWFTESQFESYRALGEHAIQMITAKRDSNGKILQERKPKDLLEFVALARDYLSGFPGWSLKTTPVRLVA